MQIIFERCNRFRKALLIFLSIPAQCSAQGALIQTSFALIKTSWALHTRIKYLSRFDLAASWNIVPMATLCEQHRRQIETHKGGMDSPFLRHSVLVSIKIWIVMWTARAWIWAGFYASQDHFGNFFSRRWKIQRAAHEPSNDRVFFVAQRMSEWKFRSGKGT